MSDVPSTQFIVPAAGLGTRLGFDEPKALVPLGDSPLLIHTLAVLDRIDMLNRTIVLCPADYVDAFHEAIDEAFPSHNISIHPGGTERQDSVRKGLESLDENTVLVAVHDAARPFVESTAMLAVIEAAAEHGGATLCAPCVDTILECSDDDFLESTPDRARLRACATPQVFDVGLFRKAHQRAHAEARRFTDDATLFRAYGGSVKLVPGHSNNLKITTAEDLAYADYRLAQEKSAN